jgi:hypothetical protein
MKPLQLYQHLKELAEKLDITVSEENFRKDGVHVRSGFCVAGGEKKFLMNKHAKISAKIDLLAAFLSKSPHDQFYVVPAVRDVLREAGAKDPVVENEGELDERTRE